MAIDDAANIGKPDACTLEVFLAVQALKNAEEVVGILHIKPHSVVTDENHDLGLVSSFMSDFDRECKMNMPNSISAWCLILFFLLYGLSALGLAIPGIILGLLALGVAIFTLIGR